MFTVAFVFLALICTPFQNSSIHILILLMFYIARHILSCVLSHDGSHAPSENALLAPLKAEIEPISGFESP